MRHVLDHRTFYESFDPSMLIDEFSGDFITVWR